MAAIASTSAGDGQNNNSQPSPSDRLKLLYSAVNEEDTPLPRSWSPKDKYNFIGLSQNNLRVHYKGQCHCQPFSCTSSIHCGANDIRH